MKIGKAWYLIAFFVLLSSLTQTAEEKIPSLAELAAKKSAESVEIDNPAYEKLIPENKQRILIQKGTLNQVLIFVKAHQDIVSQDLIASIPNKFWEALLNESTTIQGFVDEIKHFSVAEQRWLMGALTEKVLQYLNQDHVNYYMFQRCVNENPPTYCMDERLPIEFKPTGGLQSFRIKEKIITEFNYLLIRFIVQQLQNLFLNNLEFDENTKQEIGNNVFYNNEFKINDALKNKIRAILDQLISFSQVDDHAYVYASQLREILNNLLNKKITSTWIHNLQLEK